MTERVAELRRLGVRPRVSIVIPAYNEQDCIVACLEAATRQTVPASEILVIDNRSTDATSLRVREFKRRNPQAPVTLLHQDVEQGLIPTRDFGFDHASGDVLGRIDADSVLRPDWVARVGEAFADPDVAAATGPVWYYDMPFERFGLRADHGVRRMLLGLNREYRFVFGSNMALSADAWGTLRDQVCRDEHDELHEDIDLSIHLAENGLHVRYLAGMVCGISARRMDSSFHDYNFYVQRFRRTYARHRLNRGLARAPQLVLYSIYPTLHVLRQVQRLQHGGPHREVFDADTAGSAAQTVGAVR